MAWALCLAWTPDLRAGGPAPGTDAIWEQSGPSPEEEGTAPRSAEEAKWRRNMDEAAFWRNALVGGGFAGVGVGAAFFVSGLSQNLSAGDVPGCVRDGDSVTCNTPAARDEAQRRIDEGRSKAAAGYALGLAGAAAVVGGLMSHNRLRRLTEEGKKKGFTLALTGNGPDRLDMTLAYQF